MSEKQIRYEKLKSTVRARLIGMKYYKAYKALDLGLEYHKGFRKDGVTPEFQHQIEQMLYAFTMLNELLHPEETLATIALHDIVEDHNVPKSRIYAEYGPEIGRPVELMTNAIDGIKIPKEIYYGRQMWEDPVASIAKGIDRFHNHGSMAGVFSINKMGNYIAESEEFIIPMIRKAIKHTPQQANAYWNILTVLGTQIDLVKFITNQPSESK